MQNLHFQSQTLIVFAKAIQFCRISFLTPLRFGRAKRLKRKPPRFKLRACYSKLIGYAALSCASSIKPINGACLKIVGICSSMLSFSVPFMDRGKVPQRPGTATKFIGHWFWLFARHHAKTRLCITLPFALSFIANIAQKDWN